MIKPIGLYISTYKDKFNKADVSLYKKANMNHAFLHEIIASWFTPLLLLLLLLLILLLLFIINPIIFPAKGCQPKIQT